MRGAIPPLPQYVFMAWCLVKHRNNFTFTFTFSKPCRARGPQILYPDKRYMDGPTTELSLSRSSSSLDVTSLAVTGALLHGAKNKNI
jgi:hypothetical protein